jgi:hypothetical protein
LCLQAGNWHEFTGRPFSLNSTSPTLFAEGSGVLLSFTYLRIKFHKVKDSALRAFNTLEIGSVVMPEKATIEAAKEDLQERKSPSTAAGEFVREEIDHVREGKHGARSPQNSYPDLSCAF